MEFIALKGVDGETQMVARERGILLGAIRGRYEMAAACMESGRFDLAAIHFGNLAKLATALDALDEEGDA